MGDSRTEILGEVGEAFCGADVLRREEKPAAGAFYSECRLRAASGEGQRERKEC